MADDEVKNQFLKLFVYTVEGRGIFTIADRYFEIPHISLLLGHRRFRLLSGSNNLEEIAQTKRSVPVSEMILTALKIASFLTVILPLFALAIKAFGYATLKAKFFADSPLKKIDPTQAKQFWKDSLSFMEDPSLGESLNSLFKSTLAERMFTDGHIHNRRDTTRPFCEHLERHGGFHSIPGCFDPTWIEGCASTCKELISNINNAFSAGFKVWTVQANWNGHVRSLSIFRNGQVRLIDPMTMNNHYELDLIVTRLNESGLTGDDNQPLIFTGEAITTDLQRDVIHCSRLSALYSYAIALTGDPDGWQRVHGALLNGKLASVDDLENLKTAPKVVALGQHDKSLYWPLIRSIYYRVYGLKIDHWHQLKFHQTQLYDPSKNNEFHDWTAVLLAQNQTLDQPFTLQGSEEVIGEVVAVGLGYTEKGTTSEFWDKAARSPHEIQLEPVDESKTLGEIKSLKGENVYLIEDVKLKKRVIARIPAYAKLDTLKTVDSRV